MMMKRRFVQGLLILALLCGAVLLAQPTAAWALDGTGTADDPYQISTAEELKAFAGLVNDGDGDACAVLTTDITLNGSADNQWTPIGDVNNKYIGTFDGNNKTISGLYIDSDAEYVGLFGYIGEGGTVKNLTLADSYIRISRSGTNTFVGGICGDSWGSITNCHNSGIVNVNGGTYTYVGGICGRNSGSIENCDNSGDVAGTDTVGGICGRQSGGSITTCSNSGKVTVTGTGTVGGICGYNYGGITTCSNSGTVDVTGGDSVGGICGENHGTIKNCSNTGSVSGSGNVGGICGYNYGGSIENCSNIGTVTGSGYYVGGICGSNAGDRIENCSNIGTVTVTGSDKVGGICGYNDGSITNCSNSGTVTGSDEVGGICGYNDGSITNCSNSGPVTGSDYSFVGGICGLNSGSITNCSNSGAVNVNGVTYTYVGGICGYNWDSITNCYWLDSTAKKGVGVNEAEAEATVTEVLSKNAAAYKSGEVAWLLNQGQTDKPWGQGSNDMPVLISNCPEGVTTKTPVRITIKIQNETKERYGYTTAGSTLASYPNDYMFFEDDQYRTIIDKATKTFDEDTTIYAQAASPVTGIALNKTSLALYVNDTEQLTATVAPEGADGTILWTSSDSKVATVDRNGSVHAVSVGTATITAAAASDSSKNAACTVTVTESVYGITADTTTLNFGSVYTGYAQPAAQTVTVKNTGNQTVTLNQPSSTDNFEVGTLSKTKLAAGDTATITVQPKDKLPRGSYSEQITISGNDGASATLTASFTVKEPPYTGKYSYEVSTSVGDHGSLTVDRYATEGERVTITVTPDDAYLLDELVVTAGGKEVTLTAGGDGTYTFTMPSADVKITATFAEDPDWTEPEEPATDVSDIFLDIAPNAWYKDAVQYAYDSGLMTGVSANEFAPEATTTRAMIVSMLARLEGVESAESAGFTDVAANDWYAQAVNWAASVGVVNGMGNGTFQPNTAITREQMAAILRNYAEYKGQDVSARATLDTYNDATAISSWANDVMSWAVAEGLLTGVTNDQLQPQGNATRAQVAAILERFLAE